MPYRNPAQYSKSVGLGFYWAYCTVAMSNADPADTFRMVTN